MSQPIFITNENETILGCYSFDVVSQKFAISFRLAAHNTPPGSDEYLISMKLVNDNWVMEQMQNSPTFIQENSLTIEALRQYVLNTDSFFRLGISSIRRQPIDDDTAGYSVKGRLADTGYEYSYFFKNSSQVMSRVSKLGELWIDEETKLEKFIRNAEEDYASTTGAYNN